MCSFREPTTTSRALDDLIANKRASGRARDLADVELLERVRKTNLSTRS